MGLTCDPVCAPNFWARILGLLNVIWWSRLVTCPIGAFTRPGAHHTQSSFTTGRDWTRVTTHMFFTAPTAERCKRTFLEIRFPIENPIHSVCPPYLFWLNDHKSPYIACRSLSSLSLQHSRKYPNQLYHPDTGGIYVPLKCKEHPATTQCRNPKDCSHLKSSLCEDMKLYRCGLLCPVATTS